MLKWLKRLVGKKQEPRKYQVPEGLVTEVLTLWDMSDDRSSAHRRMAWTKMWNLIEQRCPEVQQGEWALRQCRNRIYVEERLA